MLIPLQLLPPPESPVPEIYEVHDIYGPNTLLTQRICNANVRVRAL